HLVVQRPHERLAGADVRRPLAEAGVADDAGLRPGHGGVVGGGLAGGAGEVDDRPAAVILDAQRVGPAAAVDAHAAVAAAALNVEADGVVAAGGADGQRRIGPLAGDGHRVALVAQGEGDAAGEGAALARRVADAGLAALVADLRG